MKILIKFVLIIISISVLLSFTSMDTREVVPNVNESNLNFSQDDSLRNPFKKFLGEWTLEDNVFESEFGGKYNANVNPNMSFVAKEFNTKTSILWIEDLGNIKAQIYWTFNTRTQEVNHLSSNSKGGGATGKGQFKENGDLELKLTFDNACESCYQLFSYQWRSDDEIFFRSSLFENDKPTGNYYGFTLLRNTK